MPAGRPPKPTAIKLLHVNPGGHPLNTNKPELAVGRPERPKFLRSKGARRAWEKQVQELLGMNYCTPRESVIIGMLAYYLGWYEVAANDLNERGAVIQETRATKTGDLYEVDSVNQFWSILNECAVWVDKLGSKLGYSPSDREKLHAIGAVEKKDEMEELIERAKHHPTVPLLVPDIDLDAPESPEQNTPTEA